MLGYLQKPRFTSRRNAQTTARGHSVVEISGQGSQASQSLSSAPRVPKVERYINSLSLYTGAIRVTRIKYATNWDCKPGYTGLLLETPVGDFKPSDFEILNRSAACVLAKVQAELKALARKQRSEWIAKQDPDKLHVWLSSGKPQSLGRLQSSEITLERYIYTQLSRPGVAFKVNSVFTVDASFPPTVRTMGGSFEPVQAEPTTSLPLLEQLHRDLRECKQQPENEVEDAKQLRRRFCYRYPAICIVKPTWPGCWYKTGFRFVGRKELTDYLTRQQH